MGLGDYRVKGAANWAAIACAVVLVLCWVAAGKLISDLNGLHDGVIYEMKVVKVGSI
uniref:Col_cuticle_N domain-containing protein n=1 Tax=Ascaris lumbricoides TaxID=6252 RepID=A0A0M3HGC0_ASCLU